MNPALTNIGPVGVAPAATTTDTVLMDAASIFLIPTLPFQVAGIQIPFPVNYIVSGATWFLLYSLFFGGKR